jgi:YD repeat-containing protein
VTRPTAADNQVGFTTRVADAWGRERWCLRDALGRLLEVVEPESNSSGSVFAPGGLLTKYTYDVLGDVTRIDQGVQVRQYKYDSMGRLIAERVPEKSATLTAWGKYGGADSIGEWSEVRTYDERTGQIATITDARGIRTLLDYVTDPLGRLQYFQYVDERNVLDPHDPHPHLDPSNSVVHVPPTTYKYMSSGDLSRLASVVTTPVATESFGYDPSGRLISASTAIDSAVLPPRDTKVSRGGSPGVNQPLWLITNYSYDSVGRLKTTQYPLHLGENGNPHEVVTLNYGLGGQITSVDLGNSWTISAITYDASGQLLGRRFSHAAPGTAAFGVEESFSYDPKSLLEQKHMLTQLGTTTALFNTGYEYTLPPSASGLGAVTAGPPPLTGQITRENDYLRPDGSAQFEYDALGRLSRAKLGTGTATTGDGTGVSRAPIAGSGTVGVTNPNSGYESLQEYQYDRFGNRLAVKASGQPPVVACLTTPCPAIDGPTLPAERHDGWPQLSADANTNHITTSGFRDAS